MNITLFFTVFLITLSITTLTMNEKIKEYELLWELPLEESDNTQDSIQWETLSEESIDDQSLFSYLPKELMGYLLLKLDFRGYLKLLQTDRLRKTICSENLIRRLLIENRYTFALPKNTQLYLSIFPIENNREALNLNMLLIISAHLGYINDMRIMLNTPYVSNQITKKDAYAMLSTAVVSNQKEFIKLLLSQKNIRKKITHEEWKEIILLSNDNKKTKKLVKKEQPSKCIIF